jgi:hypothetical protein
MVLWWRFESLLFNQPHRPPQTRQKGISVDELSIASSFINSAVVEYAIDKCAAFVNTFSSNSSSTS